jgi:hypothetical protein
MKIHSLLLVLGSLSAVACASDATVICEKMDECNLLEGQSVDDCTEEVDKAGTDSTRADCAECVDEKSCTTISNGGCTLDCIALFE